MKTSTSLEGKRVLVIEDDYYLASDEASALEAAGMIVVGCTGNAEEARRIIDAEHIHCALVDINLGEGPAFATARALRDRLIPFLFTTGYDAAIIPDEFGGISRLEKPFDSIKLLTALEQLM